MAQYYTLEEAARVLQLTPDEVKKLAENKKVRTFRDRGTLRYRSQDIDELARSLGLGSEPDLQLGEVPPPKKGSSPPPKKAPKSEEAEVLEYNLSLDDSDQVEIGHLPPAGQSGSKGGPSSSGKGGPSSSGRKQRSPAPKPGSDSDVRLVPDGSDVDFAVPLGDSASQPKPPTVSGRRPSTLNPAQTKKPSTPPPGKRSKISSPDSSVQMVPLDDSSDSDVKVPVEPEDSASLGRGKTASDSDIRVEPSKSGQRRDSDDALVTEEIDLDAELASPSKPPSSKKPGASKPPSSKPGSGKSAKPASGKAAPGKPPASKPAAPQLPKESPFELSGTDLDEDKSKSGRAPKRTQHKPADSDTDSSDEFELTPGQESSSPLELGSDEVPAHPSDSDAVILGDVKPGDSDSGINLRDPADSGISLEQEGSGEIEFELSLDDSSTPKPAPATVDDESSSEFELSLDDESSPTMAGDSSEFELSLDDSGSSELEKEPAAQQDDSDSEFELTLDESAGSSPLEDSSGERDIFETDFEVPSLEDESGSEAVALDEDTDLESDSSDFDLALSDEDMVAEDESGSQVVALEDEEEADEGAATVSRPRRGGRGAVVEEEEEEESEFAGIGAEVEEEEEEEAVGAPGRARVEYREAPTAPWGPLPALLLAPCVLILFVVGLMGFELVQSMLAYQKGNQYTGLVIGPLSDAVGLGKPPGSDTKGKK